MGKIDLQYDLLRKLKNSQRKREERKHTTPEISNCHDECSDADPTQNDAGGSNQEHLVKYMDPDIYRAVTTGDINGFKLATEDREGLSLMEQVTPQGNTVLHLAAISGFHELVELVLTRCPNLISSVNSMGNLAHHVAANAGHLSSIQHLVELPDPANIDLLTVGNKHGDSPLHMAMKNCHKEVAMFLFEKNPKVACYPNEEHKSPLYMAAEAGSLELERS